MEKLKPDYRICGRGLEAVRDVKTQYFKIVSPSGRVVTAKIANRLSWVELEIPLSDINNSKMVLENRRSIMGDKDKLPNAEIIYKKLGETFTFDNSSLNEGDLFCSTTRGNNRDWALSICVWGKKFKEGSSLLDYLSTKGWELQQATINQSP